MGGGDWRGETLSSGREPRRTPGWVERLSAWARSRAGRALGVLVAAAALAGVAAVQLRDDAPKTGERVPPGGTGEAARITPGIGRLWQGPRWFATEEVLKDLDRVSFEDEALSDAERIFEGFISGNAVAGVFTVMAMHPSVTLQGVHVTDLRCGPPVAGTVIETSSGGGTGEPVVSLAVDLDAPTPAATPLNDGEEGPALYPGTTLKQFEIQRFEVIFSSFRRCSFRAHLAVLSGSRPSLIEIPSTWTPDEQPVYGFEVTGPHDAYSRAYTLTPTTNGIRFTPLHPSRITLTNGDLRFPTPT